MELHRPSPVTERAPAAGNSYGPALARASIRPQRWGALNPLAWLLRREHGPRPVRGAAMPTGRLRRLVLLALSLAPAAYATWLMAGMLPGEAVVAQEDPDLLDWFMEVSEPPRPELKDFIKKLKFYVHG